MGADEIGECGHRGDGRVWEQEKWEGVGAGEMGVRTWEFRWCGSRGDGKVWEQDR